MYKKTCLRRCRDIKTQEVCKQVQDGRLLKVKQASSYNPVHGFFGTIYVSLHHCTEKSIQVNFLKLTMIYCMSLEFVLYSQFLTDKNNNYIKTFSRRCRHKYPKCMRTNSGW